MNAYQFMKDFRRIFVDERESAENAYCSNKNFTSFIIKRINKIIYKNGFATQNEYFRIDAIGWTPRADLIEDTDDVRLSHHLWDLEVAVEHENDQRDWMDEVVKLSHIICPLRVVIGYLPWEKRNSNSDFDLLNLNHVAKELKKLACYENMLKGEFLVILGNCNTSEEKSRYFGYKGYIFDVKTQSFMPLSE